MPSMQAWVTCVPPGLSKKATGRPSCSTASAGKCARTCERLGAAGAAELLDVFARVAVFGVLAAVDVSGMHTPLGRLGGRRARHSRARWGTAPPLCHAAALTYAILSAAVPFSPTPPLPSVEGVSPENSLDRTG